jgi:hypothetical protein
MLINRILNILKLFYFKYIVSDKKIINEIFYKFHGYYLRVPSFDIFATGVSEARQTLKLPFIGLPE